MKRILYEKITIWLQSEKNTVFYCILSGFYRKSGVKRYKEAQSGALGLKI